MLKKLRIALAACCFVCITLLFLGIGRDWWGWLPKLQALPLTMRVIGGATLGNIALLLGLLLLTWLLGRIYCSVLCPLGVFQDLVLWIRRSLGKKVKPLRKKFKFNKEHIWLRYGVLAAFVVCIIADLQLVVALLGPYSAYGRMVSAFAGSVSSTPVLVAAIVTLVVIAVCAWVWGRAWCNSICPVGTVLGSVSRLSLFGIKVDHDKCVKCGMCSRECKSSCIEEGSLKIDRSRCVDCFNCIGVCRKGALSYGLVPRKDAGGSSTPVSHDKPDHANNIKNAASDEEAKADKGRRAFLGAGAALVATAAGSTLARAQEMKLDGGLAPLLPKQAIERNPRLVPPGARSVKNFYDSCTACQLCITACPNGVLRPSTDLDHLLQPQMGYENGFCRPECTACSQVCPAGAIRPVDKEEKTLIRIGLAEVNADLCLAAKGEAGCGACARHCPSGAITMVTLDSVSDAGRRTRRPVVAEEQCIGCGKCEYLCPSRPVSAITVRGLDTQITKQ